MSDGARPESPPEAGWRLKLGLAIFASSIVLPVAGIPAVASLDLSTSMSATVTGVLLAGAEVLGLVAIATMGKPGYLYMRSRALGWLKQLGPPREVSRTRYNVGLALFCLPILLGWSTPYLMELFPEVGGFRLAVAAGGDLLLVVSLFVLGGDFWDKIGALFVHDSTAKKANEEPAAR